jgi:hypothetical protein
MRFSPDIGKRCSHLLSVNATLEINSKHVRVRGAEGEGVSSFSLKMNDFIIRVLRHALRVPSVPLDVLHVCDLARTKTSLSLSLSLSLSVSTSPSLVF